MKKCPVCSKTYDDNLKFCQADGTPLVDDQPDDPYKTMVANQADLPIPPEKPKEESKPAEPTPETPAPPAPVADVKPETPPVPPAAKDEPKPEPAPAPEPEPPEVEELDPMKTMMITGNTRDNVKVDIPDGTPKEESPQKDEPKVETPKAPPPPPPPAPELELEDESVEEKAPAKTSPPAPELPKFDSPDVAPPVLESTKLDAEQKKKFESDSLPTPPAKPPTEDLPEVETPPKPEASPKVEAKPKQKEEKAAKPKKDEREKPSVPIPSPFDKSMPPGYAPPSTPPFDPSEPVKAEKVGSAKASSGTEGMSAPPAPLDNVGEDKFGSNKIADGSASGAEGENKTLAIVSLVCGILSMTLCCGSVGLVLGPVGAITGFMAKGKINENPQEYGGKSLATAGLITGIVGTILSVIFMLLYVLRYAAIFSVF